ncbi:MAG: aminotransferase class III-fold pyridoxal phosphate-dependent enzyme [Candidatus Tectomicrobia bacterium]|uniref:Aminotransferase class III-fold pyridoxal phosphate-dependent enzyme n=1 Tax=Tectimicrobiota bacterium TaxID=2528274 RepID=A0A933GNF5_UNCTE|nr:aminotransferase class III-fold pyridoxal phosphate-dependent enzyme [Candidatus Tectomicrobia bacterium]
MKRDSAYIRIKNGLPGPKARKWITRYLRNAATSTYVYPFVWDVAKWAEGPFCTDPDGNIFLDFYSHVGSAPLGYNHPDIIHDCGVLFDPIRTADHDTYIAMGEDPDFPGHLSARGLGAVDFKTSTHLQEKLLELCHKFQFDKVFFVNSGAEAVSNAMKIAFRKKYLQILQLLGPAQYMEMCSQLHVKRDSYFPELLTDYPFFGLALEGAFHGRTMDALSLNKSKFVHKEGYPALRWIKHIPFTGESLFEEEFMVFEDLEKLIKEKTLFKVIVEEGRIPHQLLAFIIVEPIQGEGGYRIPDSNFMDRLQTLARSCKALFISDEVQAGLFRTGRVWGIEYFNVCPDIITSAKALRLGAVLSRSDIFPQERGAISSTWGGGIYEAAVGYKTIEVIQKSNLMENTLTMGNYLMDELRKFQTYYPFITDVRGRGLMVGLEFDTQTLRNQIVQSCFEKGLLIIGCGEKTIRFLPPLDIRTREVDMGLETMEKVFKLI